MSNSPPELTPAQRAREARKQAIRDAVIRKLLSRLDEIADDVELRSFTLKATFGRRVPARHEQHPPFERVLFAKECGDDL